MTELEALVAAELAVPADPRVVAMAAAVAARHPTARAVLFYGSCLRAATLDGLMLDFYLIVGDYRAAYHGHRALAAANRAVPPNVFPFEHEGLAAKYAVLSEADFRRLASAGTRNVSIWARFAQPARLVWQADAQAADAAVRAVAGAAPALLAAARPCLPDQTSIEEYWSGAFALTYRAELRAERGDRAGSVVAADPARYRAFTRPALAAAGIAATIAGDRVTMPALPAAVRAAGARAWARRRREGKALTLLRLAKASATFAGGIDYLAWKINRHAGTAIAIRPWQRRWPILGALTLLPRLLRGRAIG